MPVQVKGLREINRAFKHADREARLSWRAAERQVAEPVRRDAEQLALSSIRRMQFSPRWARMRTGVTQSVVYVAPRQKGSRGRGPRSRGRQFGDLLMDRAMEPALHRHEHEIAERVERLLDRVSDDFNRGA